MSMYSFPFGGLNKLKLINHVSLNMHDSINTPLDAAMMQ